MATRMAGLTGATLPTAPSVCHDCIWWQARPGRSLSKDKWIERAEDAWGAWGTVYYDDDGRLLGSMQYGPSALFPRAAELPAGVETAEFLGREMARAHQGDGERVPHRQRRHRTGSRGQIVGVGLAFHRGVEPKMHLAGQR